MAESLPQRTPEETQADLKRFARIVQLAMRILNRHPETERVVDDEGKVVEKVLDDITLPGGKDKVWLRIGPSRSPWHPDQPVTSVTVEEQLSEAELSARKTKGIIGTAIRTEFFGDGKIEVSYEDSKESLDKIEELHQRRAAVSEFEELGLHPECGFTVDLKDSTAYSFSSEDREHVETVEQTLEKLEETSTR